MNSVTSAAVKLGVFFAIVAVCTAFVVAALNTPVPEDKVTYDAVFTDVSGLYANDVVRMSGVAVGKVDSVELSGILQCAQRVKQNHVAALHVDDSGPARRAVVQPLEALKRTARLIHGVQVTDEQYLLARPRMFGDEMAGAAKRCAVDPPRLKPERVELRAQYVGDLPDAGEVHRAAVDVDDALEQRECIGVVSIHRGNDRALCLRKRWRGLCLGRRSGDTRHDGEKTTQ